MIALIFICLIIGFFSNISDYIPDEAIEYAQKYCGSCNKDYVCLNVLENEKANFVSQCLFEGGQSLSGCRGKDIYGMIKSYNELTECLKKKDGKFPIQKMIKLKRDILLL